MKIYKTQEEVDKDIEDNKLIVDDSATFECSIIIDASLKIAGDIKAGNIKAKNILYWAFCCVYSSIRCISIKGTRKKCAKPLVIDGEIIIEK